MVTPSASGSESSARSRAERMASRSRMMRGRCFPSVASSPMSGGRPSASRCAVASELSRDFGLPCAGAEQQPRQRRVRLDVDDDRAHRTPAAPAFGQIWAGIFRPFSHGSSELAVGDDLQRRNVVGDDPRQRLVDHAVIAAFELRQRSVRRAPFFQNFATGGGETVGDGCSHVAAPLRRRVLCREGFERVWLIKKSLQSREALNRRAGFGETLRGQLIGPGQQAREAAAHGVVALGPMGHALEPVIDADRTIEHELDSRPGIGGALESRLNDGETLSIGSDAKLAPG